MNLNDYNRKSFDEFLSAIEPTLAGYNHASFSYLAIKQNEVFVLSQGQLHLSGVPLQITFGSFESATVKAGSFKLSDIQQNPKGLLNLLLVGKLTTPDGEVNFPASSDRPYSVHFEKYHSENVNPEQRQMQLVITGGNRPQFDSRKVDWELRAADGPFESIQDLSNEFAIGQNSGGEIRIEVVAHSLAAIDQSSVIHGAKAHLSLLLADGLERDKASIGFRLMVKKAVSKRARIPGSKLTWTMRAGVQLGSIEIDVESGSVLHCFANYAGETHHHYWVGDPSSFQNPRRAVHQAFDTNLEILKELLTTQGKGRDARDFESAVAWLLWMLGFSVTHLGGTPKTSDALDLIATTPQGHFLVIECTTGILKAENKLANLIDRKEKVRRSLENSGHSHLRVLPVIVTNKTREQVKTDLKQAAELGILVGTSENFPDLINNTFIAGDPDQLFKAAEDAVQRAKNPSPYTLESFSQ